MEVSRKNLLRVGGIVLIIVLFFTAKGFVEGLTASRNARTSMSETYLADLAQKLDKQLPKEVDPETRWDHVSAGPGRKFNLSYTLLHVNAADVNRSTLASGIPAIKQRACSDPEMREMLDKGVVVALAYQSSDERPIVEIAVGLTDCQR